MGPPSSHPLRCPWCLKPYDALIRGWVREGTIRARHDAAGAQAALGELRCSFGLIGVALDELRKRQRK